MPSKRVHQRTEEYAFEEITNSLKQDENEQHKGVIRYYKKGLSTKTMDFKILIEEDEDGCFIATVPSLPGCISQGKTEEEAIKNIKEAIELHIQNF